MASVTTPWGSNCYVRHVVTAFYDKPWAEVCAFFNWAAYTPLSLALSPPPPSRNMRVEQGRGAAPNMRQPTKCFHLSPYRNLSLPLHLHQRHDYHFFGLDFLVYLTEKNKALWSRTNTHLGHRTEFNLAQFNLGPATAKITSNQINQIKLNLKRNRNYKRITTRRREIRQLSCRGRDRDLGTFDLESQCLIKCYFWPRCLYLLVFGGFSSSSISH